MRLMKVESVESGCMSHIFGDDSGLSAQARNSCYVPIYSKTEHAILAIIAGSKVQ